ncbi:MAG: hypothetical protein UZ04_CHB001001943 [Chlorobi bacterium OLB4]|jgi:flagellar biogenesis protein FliO|nr:MAG: hypothetical protein UZ04_CHB001001943 [Chlorobi bacterium OLB4]MBV6398734.1 hypothetical protein [Ignavibacteria bacterium]
MKFGKNIRVFELILNLLGLILIVAVTIWLIKQL